MHGQAQEIPFGYHLVVRSGRGGEATIGIHKTAGFKFADRPPVKGFVLNAALFHDVLARVRMPSTFTQVLHALISLQTTKPVPGYVHASQREIIKEFRIANGHVADAMSYWQDILWIRMVGSGGLYQLNPFLMFRASSGHQVQAREDWIDATGGLDGKPICYIPDPGDPYEWLRGRSASRTADRRRLGLSYTTDQLTIDTEPSTEPSTESRPDTDEAFARRLRKATTTQDRVELAFTALNHRATPGEILQLLEAHGTVENRETVKSALTRLKRRYMAAQDPHAGPLLGRR